jgi:hypothetical protein
VCHTAPNLTSLQGRAPVHHVSYSSRSCLPTGEGSDGTIACPAISCGPQASSIKKSLADLLVQLGSHVSKVPNVNAIMGL